MKRYYAGHAIILVLTFIPLILVQKKSDEDLRIALQEYRNRSRSESLSSVNIVQSNIQEIYDTLQEISFFPSLRTFSHQNPVLSPEAKVSTRMAYAKIQEKIDIAEIMVTSVAFDPANSNSKSPAETEPIIAFNETETGISSHGELSENIILNMGHSQKNIPQSHQKAPHKHEAEEKEEYQLIYDQISWMKQRVPNLSKIKGIKIPMLSGPEVATNPGNALHHSSQHHAHADVSPRGIVFSVPFYNEKGDLNGVVSALILSHAIQDFLPEKNAALTNNLNGVVLDAIKEGQQSKSREWVERGLPDPELLYSETLMINAHDPQSNWLLWTGRPNTDFEKSPLVKSVSSFKLFWSSMIVASMLILMGMWGVIVRSWLKTNALLTQVAEAAQDASKAKSEFLSNMSHELRTPLNSILGMTQLLENQSLPTSTREMFNDIKRSSENLLNIVNDILDLAKIEARMVYLEYMGFDAYENVHHVANSLRPMASKKGLSLTCSTDASHLYVLGDSLRFTRIVTNLVSNAVRYTDKGAIAIHVAAQKTLSDVARIRCTVTDTGIGIEKSKQHKIFEKFQQADVSITRRYGGTGLGLTITKELIELMDGTIGLESEPGKGSTFWFEIPFETINSLPKQPVKNIHSPKIAGGIPFHRARILIAEDHDMNQRLMTKIFESMGPHYCKIVETGKQALEEIKANPYDLIIMDCHMPEMDGYEATVAIRAIPDLHRSQVPIVAMTANAMPEDEQLCLATGMNGYISKPIDIEKLKIILSEWINFDVSTSSIATVTAGTEENIVNLSTLQKNAAGDTAFIKEIIGLFITQGASQISELEELCTDGTNEQWIETSHALKGTAGSVGAEKMHMTCAQAQEMATATAHDRKLKLEEIRKEYLSAKEQLIAKGLYTCST